MIDFENEIKKYNILDISSIDDLDIKNDYILDINKDIRKIGKVQYNLSVQIDDMFESIENLSELNNIKSEYETSKKQYENEKIKFIKNIVEILDSVEDFIHYSKKNLDSNLNNQISLMWYKLGIVINKIGLFRIDNENEIFSNEVHIAKEVISMDNRNNNEIIETLNSGYIFEKKIIRKSNVIVNKKGIEING